MTTAAPFHFHGQMLLLDPGGALWWPSERLLAVADLHLEKGTAAAARGNLVPPWDSRLTLERLAALVRRYAPATLACLGDSFHDDGGPSRLERADRARLGAIAAETDVVWIAGNHDPAAPDLPGRAVAALTMGPFTFRHQARADGRGEISGHFHPKASVAARATQITRPCFMTGEQKIMLPAFGAYTGGLDIRAPAIAAHFPRGGRVFLLGRERLYSFSLSRR